MVDLAGMPEDKRIREVTVYEWAGVGPLFDWMEKEDADEDPEMDMVWRIVVEKESMEARGLAPDDFVIDVEVLPSAELADLMAAQDVVLSG